MCAIANAKSPASEIGTQTAAAMLFVAMVFDADSSRNPTPL